GTTYAFHRNKVFHFWQTGWYEYRGAARMPISALCAKIEQFFTRLVRCCMFPCLLTCLVVFSALVSQTDAPKGVYSPIICTWISIVRHVAIGSLFQPVHGVRKREALVTFQLKGGQLTGFAIMPDHKAISFQERWKDGRTTFRNVQFANNKLTFEFDIAEWRM